MMASTEETKAKHKQNKGQLVGRHSPRKKEDRMIRRQKERMRIYLKMPMLTRNEWTICESNDTLVVRLCSDIIIALAAVLWFIIVCVIYCNVYCAVLSKQSRNTDKTNMKHKSNILVVPLSMRQWYDLSF